MTHAPSFLHGLDAEARELLLSVSRPVAFAPGAVLARHGEAARGAFVLESGEAEAVVTLPGGESLTVARLEAGGVFGEMALIEMGTCTATIRAASPVRALFIANEDFRALVSLRHPAAQRLHHAVTAILADKLAALNEQLAACPSSEDRPERAGSFGGDPLEAFPRLAAPPFEASGFLPRLAFFERFAAEEIAEVLARSRYLELPRGQAIYVAGSAPQAAFVVVRGAAEVVAMRGGRERRLAVLGPGQLLGFLGVLRGHGHSVSAFAREAALLLELPAAAFRELYFGSTRTAALVRQAVQRNLLASMARTNRSLARLLSQARLDESRRQEARLEAALHGQLTVAAGQPGATAPT